jgi:hypothetical protein
MTLPTETIEEWVTDMGAASEHSLVPARTLVDSSRARELAVSLHADLSEAAGMHREVRELRERAQSDEVTRPEELRERWSEFQQDFETRAESLDRRLREGLDRLPALLAEEALPVSADPNAAKLARDEIELALKLAGRDNKTAGGVMAELASRGGEIAAQAASSWGQLKLVEADGAHVAEASITAVRRAAVEAVLENGDEPRRRAALALRATETNRPGEHGSGLNEAVVKGIHVLGDAGKIVKEGPRLKGLRTVTPSGRW